MSDRCCYIKRDGTRCIHGGRTKVGRDDGVIDTFCHSHNPTRMEANRAKHRERYYVRKAAEAETPTETPNNSPDDGADQAK